MRKRKRYADTEYLHSFGINVFTNALLDETNSIRADWF